MVHLKQLQNGERIRYEVLVFFIGDDMTHSVLCMSVNNQIEIIRKSYVCDCLDCRQTCWVCEHIAAAMSLLGKMDVQALLGSLPVKKRPGGQYKDRGELARARYDKTDPKFFSISHLEQLFIQNPTVALQWSVTKEFDVKVGRGQTSREFVAGKVDCYTDGGGRYQWKVKYTHGLVDVEDVETLALLVSDSHTMGTRVIPQQ